MNYMRDLCEYITKLKKEIIETFSYIEEYEGTEVLVDYDTTDKMIEMLNSLSIFENNIYRNYIEGHMIEINEDDLPF